MPPPCFLFRAEHFLGFETPSAVKKKNQTFFLPEVGRSGSVLWSEIRVVSFSDWPLLLLGMFWLPGLSLHQTLCWVSD